MVRWCQLVVCAQRPCLLASCALCLPCKRLSPALSCLTSGTIVEFSIETAYDVLGFKQTSRSATQNRSERERYLSRVGARGCSDRSHFMPCACLRPAVSHRSSDTIVASATELSMHNPNISHAGRTALRHMGGAQQLSVALKADAVLWESAILVLPRGALSASLLEIRAPASILRIE